MHVPLFQGGGEFLNDGDYDNEDVSKESIICNNTNILVSHIRNEMTC